MSDVGQNRYSQKKREVEELRLSGEDENSEVSDDKMKMVSNNNRLFAGIISLFNSDSHQCLTFKHSITCEMSLQRIDYITKMAVKQ